MTASKPNYFPKAPPLNTITLGVWLQEMNLGRGIHIQSIAMAMPFSRMGTQKKDQFWAGCIRGWLMLSSEHVVYEVSMKRPSADVQQFPLLAWCSKKETWGEI